jgi:hypothetical protein
VQETELQEIMESVEKKEEQVGKPLNNIEVNGTQPSHPVIAKFDSIISRGQKQQEYVFTFSANIHPFSVFNFFSLFFLNFFFNKSLDAHFIFSLFAVFLYLCSVLKAMMVIFSKETNQTLLLRERTPNLMV